MSTGLEIRVLETDDGRIDETRLEALLEGATVLCLSAVDWLYGRVHPVEELVVLAHSYDALALVDAVQAVGQGSVDLKHRGADVVAAAGQKWLLGPWGAGFLHVDEAALPALEPLHVGYRSVSSSSGGTYTLEPDSRRFELATMSPAPFAGLETALSVIDSVGQQAISRRIQQLRSFLVEAVPENRLLSPPAELSGLPTVSVENPKSIVETLEEQGVSVRSVSVPNAIRVSVHAPNTEADLEGLIEVLEQTWQPDFARVGYQEGIGRESRRYCALITKPLSNSARYCSPL